MNTNNRLTPLVSIVTLNYNNFSDTSKCVNALNAIDYPNYSIIIVDNHSPDGSGEKLKRTFPELTILLSPTNGGYAAGSNIGIRHAVSQGCDYVLVLNPDTIVEPNVVRELLDVIENDTTVGVSTARTIYSRTGDLYVSAGSISTSLCAIIPLSDAEYSVARRVTYVAGCAMMIKRKVIDEIGLFDERYFMYYEDVEYSMRVGKKYSLVYTPSTTIQHVSGGGDQWHNYSPFYLYYSSRNRILAFGNGTTVGILYAAAVNTLNIVVKILYLGLEKIKGKDNSFEAQSLALIRGLKDGILQKTGRSPLY